MQFELAILYWFYKEPEVTRDHLKILKKHNPGRKIYGLFGGDPGEANRFKEELDGLLDDFWVYPGTYGTETYEKWIHGDLLLLDWYDKRGRDLAWDSIAITQWDMLVFDDIAAQLPGLQKGQLFFAGFRDLDSALERQWAWTRPDYDHCDEYKAFLAYIAQEYDYHDTPKTCLYLLEVLTKKFFEDFLTVKDKKIGMLEYKDPTLAHIFKHDMYVRDIGVHWPDWREPDESPLIAMKKYPLRREFVEAELARPDGWRIFHSFKEIW